MVMNVTVYNISAKLWWSVVMVQKNGLRERKPLTATIHVSHFVVTSTSRHACDMN